MTSEHVIRVTAGQSSTRSAPSFALRRSAASVTRPTKGEILVMERQVPSVHLDDVARGIAPLCLSITGLPTNHGVRTRPDCGEPTPLLLERAV
jgi:hypothetical protein